MLDSSCHARRPWRCYFLINVLAALLLTVSALPSLAVQETTTELESTALSYLESHRGDLGLTAQDLEEASVIDRVVSRHTGALHLYLKQRYNGIEVHNAILNITLTRDGVVAHIGNRFVPDVASAVVPGDVLVSPEQAVTLAASALDLGSPQNLAVLQPAAGRDRKTLFSEGGISHRRIPAKLIYQPLENGRVKLAWDLEIEALDSVHWWSVRLDAETGRLLHTDDFVDQEQYRVYPQPIESPHHTTPLPPADARSTAVDPFLDGGSSPFGWHDTDGAAGPEFTITRGNNVHAYADRDANDTPDAGADAEPNGGAGLDFTGLLVPMDLNLTPNNYVKAAITNLFYWNNIIHDVLWEYGFDEASGNFQVNNYGNGGLGNDDVQAEAQDGSGNCNANFGTPADGARPRMQMFTCNNAAPTRDGDFDHGVIAHEYGHGVSNRLTGGPAQAGCLSNTEQMGEGWSDFLGLMFTQEVGDAGTDARGTGTYLFGQGPGGPGIRPAPYSTDFGVNNFTYGGVSGVSIPHGVGFVWNTMLWDMTWALIDRDGFNPDIYGDWTTGGNNLALQLVLDGMKMQSCLPGFVDGREGILAADDVLTGDGTDFSGVNQCLIWNAFATRGLGWSADQGSNQSVTDGTQAFDLPPMCETIGAVPAAVSICQGDTADFRIGVGSMFAAPPVTMSATGAPAGTTASFSVNPVIGPVPATTVLQISNTAAAAAGSHTINVIGMDGGATSFSTAVMLEVFDSTPTSGPGLTAPADTATGEPIAPVFQWTAIGDADSYTLEVDDDPAFGSIDYMASGLTGTSHTPTTDLNFLTTYYWRVRGDNICGGGVDSAVFSFTTLLFPGDCPPTFSPVLHFQDDLDAGAAGWTSGGTGNTWALSGARTTSGASAFFAQDPASGSDQRLVSPAMVLPAGVSNLTLQFQNYQAFETPNGDGRCWDAGVLEVSTDGGTTWSQVPGTEMLTDPYDNIIWNDTAGNNPITNDYGATQAWCNELEPFVASVVDISTWAGQTVNFAWRLGSDGAAGNEGWYIDDVTVQSCAQTPFFTDGFESGNTSAWSATAP